MGGGGDQIKHSVPPDFPVGSEVTKFILLLQEDVYPGPCTFQQQFLASSNSQSSPVLHAVRLKPGLLLRRPLRRGGRGLGGLLLLLHAAIPRMQQIHSFAWTSQCDRCSHPWHLHLSTRLVHSKRLLHGAGMLPSGCRCHAALQSRVRGPSPWLRSSVCQVGLQCSNWQTLLLLLLLQSGICGGCGLARLRSLCPLPGIELAVHLRLHWRPCCGRLRLQPGVCRGRRQVRLHTGRKLLAVRRRGWLGCSRCWRRLCARLLLHARICHNCGLPQRRPRAGSLGRLLQRRLLGNCGRCRLLRGRRASPWVRLWRRLVRPVVREHLPANSRSNRNRLRVHSTISYAPTRHAPFRKFSHTKVGRRANSRLYFATLAAASRSTSMLHPPQN